MLLLMVAEVIDCVHDSFMNHPVLTVHVHMLIPVQRRRSDERRGNRTKYGAVRLHPTLSLVAESAHHSPIVFVSLSRNDLW